MCHHLNATFSPFKCESGFLKVFGYVNTRPGCEQPFLISKCIFISWHRTILLLCCIFIQQYVESNSNLLALCWDLHCIFTANHDIANSTKKYIHWNGCMLTLSKHTLNKPLYKWSCLSQISIPAILYQTDGEKGRVIAGRLGGGKHTVFQLIKFSNFIETQP